MRVRAAVVGVLCLVVVATGCDLRFFPIPGPAPIRYRDPIFSGVTKTADITYGSAVDSGGVTEALKLDMYRPVGDTNDLRAAVVWVHGGSFTGGDKNSPELLDEANYFGQRGYLSVSINYRLSPTGCVPFGPACLSAVADAKHDAQAAVRFLRANAATYGIDPTRISVAGTSAGAITAINVAFGPEDVGTSGNPGFPSTVRSAVSLSGARVGTTPNAGEAPMLDFHGTNDPLVPYSAAQATVDAATAVGVTAYLTTYQGAGHVPYTANRQDILDETTHFLYWTMDLDHAQQ